MSYSPAAEAAIERYTAMGLDKLPICMAKTQYSFSHDPALKGEYAAPCCSPQVHGVQLPHSDCSALLSLVPVWLCTWHGSEVASCACPVV